MYSTHLGLVEAILGSVAILNGIGKMAAVEDFDFGFGLCAAQKGFCAKKIEATR